LGSAPQLRRPHATSWATPWTPSSGAHPVNNAGFAVAGFAEGITLEELRLQFETNFFGAVAMTKTVLPTMRTQRSGHIIQISSIGGLQGSIILSSYAASKHALEDWSEKDPRRIQLRWPEPSWRSHRMPNRLRYLIGQDAKTQLAPKRILPWKSFEKMLANIVRLGEP
jgi:hypothetical protein